MNEVNVDYDSLFLLNGIYHNKSNKKIFSGRVKGRMNGLIINGYKEKQWKSYYDNGKLFWIGYYKKGIKQSFFLTYYENGELLKVISYNDDLPDGEWCTYWKNGNIWIRGFYELGTEIGKWEYYNRDGSLNKKEEKKYPKTYKYSSVKTFQ